MRVPGVFNSILLEGTQIVCVAEVASARVEDGPVALLVLLPDRLGQVVTGSIL